MVDRRSLPITIKTCINQMCTASMAMAFKGAAHPDDRAGVEARYHKARHNLETAIVLALENQKVENDKR